MSMFQATKKVNSCLSSNASEADLPANCWERYCSRRSSDWHQIVMRSIIEAFSKGEAGFSISRLATTLANRNRRLFTTSLRFTHNRSRRFKTTGAAIQVTFPPQRLIRNTTVASTTANSTTSASLPATLDSVGMVSIGILGSRKAEFNRSIQVEFTDDQITSNAGVLLRQIDHQLGLCESIAAKIHPSPCKTPFEIKREIFLESQHKPARNFRVKSSSSLVRSCSNHKEPVTEKRVLG